MTVFQWMLLYLFFQIKIQIYYLQYFAFTTICIYMYDYDDD